MHNLLNTFYKTIDAVCIDWNKNHSKAWGFQVEASRKSIGQAYFFVQVLLKDNPMLPPNPGPFKMAAAFLVSGIYFVDFPCYPLPDAPELSENEKSIWKSRFLFKAIPVFLSQTVLSQTGQKLQKLWDVPTPHYRMDFLNFIRWCDLPITETPPPQSSMKPTISAERAGRLVKAMTLIVESCYYLSENQTQCDVRGKIAIKLDDFEESIQPDLFFDCK